MFTNLKKKLALRWLAAELKAFDEEVLRLKTAVGTKHGLLVSEANSAARAREKLGEYQNAVVIAVDRLELIAEKETSGANGTVRSMAKIARAAIAEVKQEICE